MTTRLQFAQACLQAFNPVSDTPAHEQAMVAWMAYENTRATWNPMATTKQEPGSTSFNSVGVQNYPNEATGVQGWLDTLNSSYYSDNIVPALLNSSSSAAQVASAVSASPWGSHPTATLAQVQAAYSTYSNIAIPDGTGSTTTVNPTTAAIAAPGTTAAAAVSLVAGGAGTITMGPAIPGFGTLSVGDIVFNGGGLTADVSNSVTDVIVERSIGNASTVTLQLDDPYRQILRSGIFNQGDSLVLDGLPFTLVSFAKASDQLQLTFEATGVYLLRQRTGLTNYTSQTDVFGFVKQLVSEVSGLGCVGETTNLSQANAISIGRGTSSDPTEDSWTCMVRLATTIGWRVWESANTIYFGEDAYWLTHYGTQGVLQEFTDQVQNMDFALALDTPIPTPSGWTTMGDIKAGDQVFGSDGSVRNVLRTSPIHLDHACYELVFDDQTTIVADANHRWETKSRRPERAKAIYTTQEIADSAYYAPGHCANHRVRVAGPLDLPDINLPIDPYILGYWLGDGTSLAADFTVADKDLSSLLQQIEAAGYQYGKPRPDKGAWRVGVSTVTVRRGSQNEDSLKGRLRSLGILGKDKKHIPAQYLRASYDQRLALLQGLLDSDGSIGNVPNLVQASFSNTNERLAKETLELVRSLGLRPYIIKYPAYYGDHLHRPVYKVSFSPRGDNAFRLPRKAERYVPWSDRTQQYRSILEIRPVESVPVKCITVDSEDHLYLVGESMLPTHNTYDVGLPFGNMTVTAMTNLWAYNPGVPVTVGGMGPANGIWLVNDMQRDLYNPQATITLMVPMTPAELIASTAGEPLAVSTSVGTGSPSSGTPNITATITPAAILSRGESFTVSANVSGAGYGNTPQGTIEFQSSSVLTDGTPETSGDLPGGSAVKLDSHGSASVTVSHGFGPGTYTIIASYSGGGGGPPPSGQWQPIDTSASPITLIVN